MRRIWLTGLVLALLIGTGATIAWIQNNDGHLAVGMTALAEDTTSDPAGEGQDTAAIHQAISDSGQAAIKQAIANAGPAVVRIDVTGTVTASTSLYDLFDDPFFRRFFGDPPSGQQQDRTTRSLGSGVVIEFDDEKLVLTNAHVVDGADTIEVTDMHGYSWTASVVGADEMLDAAVLRLDGDTTDLAVATLGDSETVEIGDWAIAIGNPLGLSYTVTMGIISGTNRDIAKPTGVGTFNDLIQTDAAINPGNSGGPLVNAVGDVIGLNTMIARSTNGGVTVEGINFAIAINGIKDVLPQLVREGEVKRGWLGVSHADVTPETSEAFDVDIDQTGTIVVGVFAGDPADVGGIEVGDVIIQVGDAPIVVADDLNRTIGLLAAGTTVEITVIRGEETLVLEVTLGERPTEQELVGYQGKSPQVDPETETATVEALGITVGSITEAVARHLGLNSTDGVVIMDIAADGRAERGGLQVGDVVLEIDHRSVSTVAEWSSAIEEIDDDAPVTLTIVRDGSLSFLTIE